MLSWYLPFYNSNLFTQYFGLEPVVDEGVGVNQMTITDERPSENDHCVPVTGFSIGTGLTPNHAKLVSRID